MLESLWLLATLVIPPPFTATAATNYSVENQPKQYYGAVTLENQTPELLSLQVRLGWDAAPLPPQVRVSTSLGACPEARPEQTSLVPITLQEKQGKVSLTAAETRCLHIGPLAERITLVFWSTAPNGVEQVSLTPSPVQNGPLNAALQRVEYVWPWRKSTCAADAVKSTLISPEGRTLQVCQTSSETVTGVPGWWATTYSGVLKGVEDVNGGKVTATVTTKHHWMFAILAVVLGLLFAAWREFLRTVAPAANDLKERAAGLPQVYPDVGPYSLQFDQAQFVTNVDKRLTFVTLGRTPTLDILEQQRAAAASWSAFEAAYLRLVTPPGTTSSGATSTPPFWYERRFAGYQPYSDPVQSSPGVVTILNDLAGGYQPRMRAGEPGAPAQRDAAGGATRYASEPKTIDRCIDPADFTRVLSVMRDGATVASLLEELDLPRWHTEVASAPAAKTALMGLERALYKPGISPGKQLSAEDMGAYARRLSAHYDRFLVAHDRAKAQGLLTGPSAQSNVAFAYKTFGTTAATGGIASGRSRDAEGDRDQAADWGRKDVALWRSQRGALLFWSALVLAVVSGLQAVYFKDNPWGTPWDYVVALTWGSLLYTGLASLSEALIALRAPVRQ
ncbi:hypothetical protein [Deinococcus aquatilis]|uniref:hypothetical protein n=1 Tax=Deinococcus aquatilis TaxID=519440 RepID=UPI000378F646|nr:hypothetical protein [Deinococcus aquatilis]